MGMLYQLRNGADKKTLWQWKIQLPEMHYSQEFLKNGLVAIIVISLPKRALLMEGIVPHIYGFMVNDTIV